MIGDNELPAGWQGSYGTLNTRRALADIHARLLRLEAPVGSQDETKSMPVADSSDQQQPNCNTLAEPQTGAS